MAAQSISSKGARQRSQARNLIAGAQSMAPSQRRKMVRIEGIDSKVMRVVAPQDSVVGALKIEQYQICYLVESASFRGFRYAVIWNESKASYECSCGNPRCTEHTKAVSDFVHAACERSVA